jgi:hypothetical protein
MSRLVEFPSFLLSRLATLHTMTSDKFICPEIQRLVQYQHVVGRLGLLFVVEQLFKVPFHGWMVGSRCWDCAAK